MSNDTVKLLEEILKRNGHVVDLHDDEKEEQRYFLFDLISEPADLDLVWSLFPAHQEIRTRAAQVDAVSNIVDGWGYRTPKKSNQCAEGEVVDLVRSHIAAITAIHPFDCVYDEFWGFVGKGYDIQVVGAEASRPSSGTDDILGIALYETIGDFIIDHIAHDDPMLRILYDWAVYFTKCVEVELYLLWPILKDVDGNDPNTPIPGFKLWQYQADCLWIKDNNLESGVICVQPAWAR